MRRDVGMKRETVMWRGRAPAASAPPGDAASPRSLSVRGEGGCVCGGGGEWWWVAVVARTHARNHPPTHTFTTHPPTHPRPPVSEPAPRENSRVSCTRSLSSVRRTESREHTSMRPTMSVVDTPSVRLICARVWGVGGWVGGVEWVGWVSGWVGERVGGWVHTNTHSLSPS